MYITNIKIILNLTVTRQTAFDSFVSFLVVFSFPNTWKMIIFFLNNKNLTSSYSSVSTRFRFAELTSLSKTDMNSISKFFYF